MTLGWMNLLMFAGWEIPALELPVDSWWFFTIVLVLLVLFIWAVTRLTTSGTEDIDPAEIDRQMLTAVSELRSRGELTNEEFRSIKGRLVERLATDQTESDTAAEATSETESDPEQSPEPESDEDASLAESPANDEAPPTESEPKQNESPE